MKQLVATVLGFMTLIVASDLAGFAETPVVARHRVLKGSEAQAHMETVWANRPGLYAEHLKTVQQLKALGAKMTDNQQTVTIVEHESPRPLRRFTALFLPLLSAQTYNTGAGLLYVSAGDTTAEVVAVADSGDYSDGYAAFDIASDGTATGSGNTTPARKWAHCVLSGCAGATAACGIAWWTGAGSFVACSIAWCGSGEVGCTVAAFLDWYACRGKGSYC